jgi:S1-C subfamily serine protease
VVQRLAAAGYPIRKVNVEHERDLAGRFGITRIPCFVMVVDGKESDRMVGATSYDRLEAMCQLGLARRKPTQPSAAAQPVLPAVQQTSAISAAPAVPVPAVESGSAFTVGPPQARQADTVLPGWRMTQPDALPSIGSNDRGVSDAQLMGATVRLRIEDANGHSCGTGTIIDARQGEALIVTCGHIFRDSKGEGRIEVDLFGPTPGEKIPGRLISYNLDRDVGLISIRTPGPVTVARVAPPGYEIGKGARVATVGCNNAEDPSVRHSRITALNKFMGPPNIEVAGLPVQGRSGGGLFSAEGYLIGICNAADPTDNEGLFAALASIHAQLDEAKLGHIYQPASDGPRGPLVAVAPPDMPKEMPAPDKLLQLTNVPARPAETSSLPAPSQNQPTTAEEPLTLEEQAALAEIRRRREQGAEVVCVIRSLSDPRAKSEIIVLDKASPAFLEQLAAESRSHVQRQLTSLELPAVTSQPGSPPPGTPDVPQRPAGLRSNWQPNWLPPTVRR